MILNYVMFALYGFIGGFLGSLVNDFVVKPLKRKKNKNNVIKDITNHLKDLNEGK